MALMTGSRFFAEAMQAYGVTHIFFVPTMLLPARPSDLKRALERAFAANKPAVIDVASDIKALAARGWS